MPRLLSSFRISPVAARWLAGGAILLAPLGGFAAGYGYGRANGALVPPLPAELAERIQHSPLVGEFGLLHEIRGLIEDDYYRPADAERQQLLYGAARGMVQALGDPNSVYETPQEREENSSRWTGRYEGVGLHVDQRDGQTVVTAPIEGGPAALAGIRPGDVLLEIDGRSVAGLTLTAQTRLIRGPKGTSVSLLIRREGAPTLLRFELTRAEIQLVSVRWRLLDGGLGLLRISQFTEQTASEARAALKALLEAGPSGALLDLRSNAGGLLEPAVEVAGLFLGEGVVVVETHANGSTRSHNAPAGPPATDLPLLVLVDRGSASAGEVLAAALRDRGRARLLGERTYGKSTVQYLHRLSDGSGLRLTVAEWRTPTGQPIPPTGLEPDWAVEVASPAPEGQDPVLEAAVAVLGEQLSLPTR
jgi:carboxyl-terminal processing protease